MALRIVRARGNVVVLLVAGALGCGPGGCGGGSAKTASSSGHASYATLINAGRTLLRDGNLGAAEQVFAQAIAQRPHTAVGHYDLGVAYQRAGNKRNALVQYIKALAADPRYVPALYNEATIYSIDSPPLAIFVYERITRLQPNAATAYLNLGLLENAGRTAHRRAVPDLQRAVQLEPALMASIPASVRSQVRPTRARSRSGSRRRAGGT